jgi:hypothetical protein
MPYLRFSPEDYHALCRLCSPLTLALDLPTFKQLLLYSLADTHPALAERVAALGGHQLGILLDHFRRRHPAGTGGERHAFSGEELRVLAEACESFHGPARFVRYLQAALAEHLCDWFPDLARKVARLSERQFERLYEQVAGRGNGSA